MIRRELSIFLVVGCLTVAIDFMLYRGLVYLFLCDIGLAKAIGFVGGSIFAYFANRFWTFGEQRARSGSFWRFTLVYSFALVANIFINQGIFMSWDGSAVIYVAFLVATGVSAILNFVGMKWFVFTQRADVAGI